MCNRRGGWREDERNKKKKEADVNIFMGNGLLAQETRIIVWSICSKSQLNFKPST